MKDANQQDEKYITRPIMKETSARLVKEKVPYEIISRDVIQSITNPVALALYAYLITLPEHWIVRRTHLLDHFDGLGRERYDTAMKQLKNLGIVWIMDQRNALGQITDKVIMVESVPKVGKPTSRGNPQVGETDHIEIQTLLRDTDNTTTGRKTKKFAAPTLEEIQAYSQEKSFTVDTDYFFEFYTTARWLDAGGKRVKNWKLKLLTWNKRDNKNGQNRLRSNTSQNQPKLTPAQRTLAKQEAVRQRELAERSSIVDIVE